MSTLRISDILLPSFAGCAYFYAYDPRGDVVVLSAIAIYIALAAYEYLATELVLSAVLHASRALITQTLLVVFVGVLYRLSPLHPLAKFPGDVLDRVTNLRLAYFIYTGRRASRVAKLHEKYGIIVRIGPNKLSINSHDAIHTIYSSALAFDKAASYRPGRVDGSSLFFVRTRTEHNRRKRAWAGALSGMGVQQWDDVMKARTHEFIECLAKRQDDRGVVDLTLAIDHWSFDFTGDLIFGTDTSRFGFMEKGDPEHVVQNAQGAVLTFEALGEVPALFDVVSGLYGAGTEHYKRMERLAAKHLKERAAISSLNGWDLCSFFLAQREGGHYSALPEADAHADIILAFEAGGDSVAGFLSIAAFYIFGQQETYKKIKEELDQAFPTGEIAADQHASLADLPFFTAAINEALRLGSGFSSFARVVPKGGAVLAEQFIPEGTVVGIPSHTQHINPDNFWPVPREYRPERWFPDGLGPGTVTKLEGFMPFQSGPFGCPGKALSYRMIYVIFAYLILAYDVEFAPEFEPEAFIKGWITTRSNILKYHLKVRAKAREQKQDA